MIAVFSLGMLKLALVGDPDLRGDLPAMLMAAVLVWIVYILTLRPKMIVGQHQVIVRNLIFDYSIPFAHIELCDASKGLRISTTSGRRITVIALIESGGQRIAGVQSSRERVSRIILERKKETTEIVGELSRELRTSWPVLVIAAIGFVGLLLVDRFVFN
jgi:hypothetical protein